MVKYAACWCYVLIRSVSNVYYRHVWPQVEGNRGLFAIVLKPVWILKYLKIPLAICESFINCIMNVILEIMTEAPWLFNPFVAFNFVFLSQWRGTFPFLFRTERHTGLASSKQNGSEKLSWLCGCLVLIIILNIYCVDFQVVYGLSKEDFLCFSSDP